MFGPGYHQVQVRDSRGKKVQIPAQRANKNNNNFLKNIAVVMATKYKTFSKSILQGACDCGDNWWMRSLQCPSSANTTYCVALTPCMAFGPKNLFFVTQSSINQAQNYRIIPLKYSFVTWIPHGPVIINRYTVEERESGAAFVIF